MYKIGFYYLKGPKLGCEQNEEKAISFFNKAAKLDYTPGLIEMDYFLFFY